MSTEKGATLSAGFHEVPPGHVAAVVTHLEMRAPPEGASPPAPPDFTMVHTPEPDVGHYRRLHRAVGEDWLWFTRLRLDDAELAALIHVHGVEVHEVRQAGEPAGVVELDRRAEGEVELVFFGLVQDVVGQGVGRWAIAEATRRAWVPGVRRFWVHTCTFDHPRALAFYMTAGFVPFRRQVEIAPDPRLDGTVGPDAARHVPVIR